MYRLAIVAAVALTACLPLRKGEDADQPERTRICVRNATAGYGNVIARVGLARYDIMPGQEVCRVSLETGATTALSARTVGGGANGPLTFNATLQAGGPGCWLWVLDNARAYSGHLRACDDDEDTPDSRPRR
jgi:hypothetical protein